MTNGAQARCYTRADTDQQFVLVRGQGLAGGVPSGAGFGNARAGAYSWRLDWVLAGYAGAGSVRFALRVLHLVG